MSLKISAGLVLLSSLIGGVLSSPAGHHIKANAHSHGLSKREHYDNARFTWYPTDTGPDACTGKNHGENDWLVALNMPLFGNSGNGHCGKQIRITINGKTAVATVADACASCPEPDQIDLTPGLFKYFDGNLGDGVIHGSWEFVDGSGGGGSPPPPPPPPPKPSPKPKPLPAPLPPPPPPPPKYTPKPPAPKPSPPPAPKPSPKPTYSTKSEKPAPVSSKHSDPVMSVPPPVAPVTMPSSGYSAPDPVANAANGAAPDTSSGDQANVGDIQGGVANNLNDPLSGSASSLGSGAKNVFMGIAVIMGLLHM